MVAINQGDVETPCGTLRCTLRAAKEVNAVFGSFTTAVRRVMEFDFSAHVAVVAAGLGKQPKEVEAAVFGVGMPDLVKPVTDYLGLLSNGGRPLDPAPAEGGDAKPGEQ